MQVSYELLVEMCQPGETLSWY